MKKNLLLYIAVFAAILMVSCSREVIPDQDKPFKDGETGLVMRVRSTSPNTRLIPAPAENALNEDVLEQFYYFFYTVNPSENATAIPVYAGKWIAPEGERITGTGIEKNILLDKLDALKVSDTKYAGYVYVIANYKDAAILADWDSIIGAKSPDYSTLTWSYFQNLSIPATFDDNYQIVSGDEIMNEKQDQGHRFKAQDSFVMDSDPAYFEVTKGTVGSIDAPLERLAVKISLNINMAKWYVQRNNGEYKYTWYSDPARTQVYLNYAAKDGKMNGTPISYIATGENANASSFFTYRRFAFLSEWTKNTDGEYVFPDGSYWEKEAYKWIYKEDAAETQPESDGNYYTSDEDKQGMVVVVDDKVVEKDAFKRPAYKITGTPFYSYPYDFSSDAGHAPFFKVIVEWTGYKESADNIATDTEPGDKNVPEVISREFFYKITIPDGLFKNTTPKVFQANHWYTINLNLSTLGSEADETAIDVSSDTYFVTNWSDPLQPDNPDINAGRYLSVTSLEKEDNKPVYHMYGSELEIPVTTSHSIEVVNTTVTYETFNPAGTEELPADSYTITPGHNNVVIEHDVVSDLNSVSAQDISIITYKFTVRQSDEAGHDYKQEVIVYQYPSIYIQKKEGGNAFVNGFFQYLDGVPTGFSNPATHGAKGYRSANFSGTQYVYSEDYTSGTIPNDSFTGTDPTDVETPYGRLGMDNINNETETTLVTVSTFDSASETFKDRFNGTTEITYHYKIMDPRVANSWTVKLTPYLTGQSGTSGDVTLYHEDWENQSAIKVGSNLIEVGTNEYNAPIAPAFLICSRWGRFGGGNLPRNLRDAELRCATYQEAGRPAGRWRLPTDAETYFVYTLQSKGLLNTMFTMGGNSIGYWTSSGRVFGYHGNPSFTSQNGNDQVSVRCVYDVWYWGDETVDKYKFTPQP